MIRKIFAFVTALVAAATLSLALSPSAAASTQVCRNVDHGFTGNTYIRVCLTYDWSPTGATYAVRDLRTWNPAGKGITFVEGFQREYDNSPETWIDDVLNLSDGETEIMGDYGLAPSASAWQCVQYYKSAGVINSLLIRPSGSTNTAVTCAANGVG